MRIEGRGKSSGTQLHETCRLRTSERERKTRKQKGFEEARIIRGLGLPQDFEDGENLNVKENIQAATSMGKGRRSPKDYVLMSRRTRKIIINRAGREKPIERVTVVRKRRARCRQEC